MQALTDEPDGSLSTLGDDLTDDEIATKLNRRLTTINEAKRHIPPLVEHSHGAFSVRYAERQRGMKLTRSEALRFLSLFEETDFDAK